MESDKIPQERHSSKLRHRFDRCVIEQLQGIVRREKGGFAEGDCHRKSPALYESHKSFSICPDSAVPCCMYFKLKKKFCV